MSITLDDTSYNTNCWYINIYLDSKKYLLQIIRLHQVMQWLQKELQKYIM